MCHNAKERLLRQVVGVSWSSDMGTETPHINLARTHEPIERVTIARLGGCGQPVEIEHAAIVAAARELSASLKSLNGRGVQHCP